MKVIDTSQDFSELAKNCSNSDGVVIPILSNHRGHPAVSELSGIYIHTNKDNCRYYISVNNSESIEKFTPNQLVELINSMNTIITIDSKEFYHIFGLEKSVIDFSVANYHLTGKATTIEKTSAHKKLYSMYWDRKNVNDIVPILKHVEYCEEILNSIKPEYYSKVYTKYSKLIKNLYMIESSGLYTKNGYEYCNYNPYTLTGRPSNTFNKVNYAALNKADGSRNKYISRFDNGMILELDYDAYHLRIIEDMEDYVLPETSIHEYLGKQYFGKEKLSPQEYSESKEISFRILYGGIPKEFLSIPFFNKVNDFIFKFWNDWKIKKEFNTYLYKRKVSEKVIGEMSPQKLFNYYIQSAETELNSEAMDKVFQVLENYSTNFILYTYDSFTFDFDMNEGKELILQIKNAMKYPTRISMGPNYGALKDVSSKFL